MDILNEIKNKQITVIGDVMLDEYLSGEVLRISQEAPIPVVQIRDCRYLPGGAANVAANLVGLGLSVTLYGVVGNDVAGTKLLELLKGLDVLWRGKTIVGRSTTTKTRIIGGNQQIVRIDNEETSPVEIELKEVLSDVVVISDYGKGVVTGSLCKKVISSGKFVMCDPKGDNWEKYRGANIVSPNFKELCAAYGKRIENTEDSVFIAALKLIKQFELGAVLVTRSEKGMTLCTKESCLSVPAAAREVYDVSGAGDTAAAAFIAAICAGASMEHATEFSNIAAGEAVTHWGTYAVQSTDLSNNGKICNPVLFAEKMRSQGKRVVFTNGCFDLLHTGHLALLRAASREGDALIVGVNSDASVKRLKGEMRPVNTLADRMEILAALDFVDCVASFDDDTPIDMIKSVKPDIIVKGGDYKLDEVVGHELARVVIVPLVNGKSTTETIARIGHE